MATTIEGAIAGAAGGNAGILAKERTVAGEGYSRWLAPPAALAIHLCIGMAYGFSVFWLPMSKLIASPDPACPKAAGWIDDLFTSTCNWSVTSETITFTLFIVFLGLAAALWGGWVERSGPRKAGVASAVCWCGGLVLGGLGVYVHQLWIVWLGTGVLGGIGLGLGYISPVSTLIKWFPDRRGMATGFAIMGFGGGAMIGAPLATLLMKHFAPGGANGVWQTYLAMAAIYLVFMLGGAFAYRVPPNGWRPAGWAPPEDHGKAMITRRHVHLNRAWKTPQFWAIWGVLCLNVSAGIGVLAMASPMFQEVFGGKLIGAAAGFNDLSPEQKSQIAIIAASLVGLLSLFNSLGRIFWASLSDRLGRKKTYYAFFVLGIASYCLLPTFGHLGAVALFIAAACLILSMYGGGFSTIPAYLADMFGTQMVGAIHGRLLTAWSVAGVIGPVLIAKLRDFEKTQGVPPNLLYDVTLYVLAALLLGGLICNALIRPVDAGNFMSDEELAAERKLSHEVLADPRAANAARGGMGVAVLLAWLAVGVPFAWGLWTALLKSAALFR
ncbi:MAG: OFA family MFS transporter [Nevskia sp.]|nr:OFA family MFS transporter [Nevskia sp.]